MAVEDGKEVKSQLCSRGVHGYATDACEIALGWQQPNALRVAFRGTTNWGLTSNKKQDLGFYYRVELSLTADFATVAARPV